MRLSIHCMSQLPAFLAQLGRGHDYSVGPPPRCTVRYASLRQREKRSGDGRYDGKGGVFLRPSNFDRFMRPSSTTSLRRPGLEASKVASTLSLNAEKQRDVSTKTSTATFDASPTRPGVNAPKARGFFYESGKIAVFDGKAYLDGSLPPKTPARKAGIASSSKPRHAVSAGNRRTEASASRMHLTPTSTDVRTEEKNHVWPLTASTEYDEQWSFPEDPATQRRHAVVRVPHVAPLPSAFQNVAPFLLYDCSGLQIEQVRKWAGDQG